MNVHQSLAATRPLESFSPPDSVPAKADAMVRFEGVEKTYPAYRGKPSVRALQNIDFAVPRGSITGVIGRSGRQLKQFSGIHQLACPSETEVYAAETSNWRVQKLILR